MSQNEGDPRDPKVFIMEGPEYFVQGNFEGPNAKTFITPLSGV